MAELNEERIIEEFEEMTKNAGKVQRETLKKILEQNGSTEYLQNLGLHGNTDPDSFKACVPLVTHKDLEPYIQRISDGDSSPILTGKPITAISLTSGTTQGKPKFVPFNDDLVDSTMQIFKTSFAFRNRDFPIGNGKALWFIYGSKQLKTTGGLSAGTATSNVYRSPIFKTMMKSIESSCCSPDEVLFGPNFNESLYCHLLCGLLFRDQVETIFSTFAHSIVHAFRAFEQLHVELYHDIRDGTLSSTHVTTSSVRNSMSKLLKPDPQLASLVHSKCEEMSSNNWYGLIPELFPNAKYVYGIMTGSMEPYLKKLRHYAQDLPLVSADYGSSEGWIGVNVNPKLAPEVATFAVIPNFGYFEFIPLTYHNIDEEQFGADHKTLGLTQVKVGEEYEIVVTNFAGLYRYQLGDVVKVMGFHNSTPELKFMCRRNLLLTINIDKNTEKDLQQTVEEASKLVAEQNLELVDFTSYVDLSTEPGHYVIFWEINGEANEQVLNECCNCLDRSFIDAGYVSSRKVNGIGALELRIVRRGTFQKIQDHYVAFGAAISQFKTPRCVDPTNQSVLRILSGNVFKSYFSTAF